MTKKISLTSASAAAALALLVTSLNAADAPAPAKASASASASAAAAPKPAAAAASASASASASAAAASGSAAASAAGKPDLSKLPKASDKKDLTFAKDIEPMLKASCSGCHIDAQRYSGGLNLGSLETALKGGTKMKDKDIVAGHGDQSFVLLYAADTIAKSEMPPIARRAQHPALTKDQLADLRAWIDQGAK